MQRKASTSGGMSVPFAVPFALFGNRGHQNGLVCSRKRHAQAGSRPHSKGNILSARGLGSPVQYGEVYDGKLFEFLLVQQVALPCPVRHFGKY